MNYSSIKIEEIRSLENKSLFFNKAIFLDSNGNKSSWSEIFDCLNIYFSSNSISTLMKKYPKEEDLKYLIEEYRVDINHVDGYGQNLLMYVLGVKNKTIKISTFYENWIPYLIQNTKDLFNVDKKKENILFSFTTFYTCGIKGEDFFDFLEKAYENKFDINKEKIILRDGFDFNQKNKLGRNVIFSCLMNGAPEQVIKFNIEQGAKLDLTDIDGYNLLYFFGKYSLRGDCGKFIVKIFDKVFEELEDPLAKNKYGNSFLEELLVFIEDNKINREKKERYIDWINYSLKKIKNLEFKINEKSKSSIVEFFNINPPIEIERCFNEAKVCFSVGILEQILAKSKSHKKIKQKI